jgi:hypothetical protein
MPFGHLQTVLCEDNTIHHYILVGQFLTQVNSDHAEYIEPPSCLTKNPTLTRETQQKRGNS